MIGCLFTFTFQPHTGLYQENMPSTDKMTSKKEPALEMYIFLYPCHVTHYLYSRLNAQTPGHNKMTACQK